MRKKSNAEKYQSLYDFAPVGYFTLNGKGIIEELNLTGATMLGYDRNYLKGLDFSFFVIEVAKSKFTLFLKGLFVHKEKETCEIAVLSNQNKTVYIHVDGIASEDSEQCLITLTDISGRKLMEDSLRASENKFRQLAENSLNIIYRILLKPELKFDYVSPSVTRITGYTPEDHYNDPNLGYKMVHPDDRILLENILTFSHNEPLVLRWIRKDGKIIWTEQTNNLILDQNNEPIAIEGNARDITERENAGLEVRKQVERSNLMLELFSKAPTLSDEELVDKVLEIAIEVTESKIGFLYKIAPDQDGIVHTTWNKESRKNWPVGKEDHSPQEDVGNWKDCLESKRPVIQNDYFNLSHRKGHPEGHTIVLRTLAIPLVHEEKVHLIVGVGNKPFDYTDYDISQIQFVVDEFYKILEKRKVETALKESERNVQNSNSHLRSILESPQGVIIFSLDLNYCYTSFTVSHLDVMKAIWGVTIEIGMNILDVISFVEDRIKSKNNFDRVYKGEYFILEEEFGDEKLFRTFWENRYSPIYDDSFNITGMTVFVIEITERRRAEVELRRSEEKYRNIFENVYDVYYEALLDGTIIEISPSIETVSKGYYTRNELIGKSIVDFYSKHEDRDRFFGELAKSGKVTDFELSMRNKDGLVMPISISSGVRQDAMGRPVIIGSMRDITERKKAEKLIARSNQDLQFLNSFALNLSRLASSDSLAGFLIKQLKEYTKATIVAYSEYNDYDQVLVTKIIETDGDNLNLIVEVTGSDLLNLKSPVSNEIYHELVVHNIHKHETFTEASFGAVPLEADLIFKERSGIRNIYGIALTIGQELYGTLLLCYKDDAPVTSEDLLQSFANLSAVALMRKRAEDDLKIGYDQLEQKVVERTLELNQLRM